jgi:DNA excision repair protein ERCC-3
MAYIEQNKRVNQSLKKGKKESHSFFKKIGRENARRAAAG